MPTSTPFKGGGLAQGAREVWKKGKLPFHLLRGARYVAGTRSELIPDLDPELIERCMKEATQTAALRALRAASAPKRARRSRLRRRKG